MSDLSALASRLLRKAAVPLVVALVIGAFLLGTRFGSGPEGGEAEEDAGAESGEASVVEHTCSMHPQVRNPGPGDCPICGMDLIPVQGAAGGDDDESAHRVSLSPRAKALARIATEPVRRAESAPEEIRLLGRLDYDERRVRTITSWTTGRIDRLHVAVTGQRVGRGKVIATIYSPEIYAAQGDLIQAARGVKRLAQGTETSRAAASSVLEATRQRLRLLGVPDDEIGRMEGAERPFRQVPIRAPFGGTVIERLADEGTYVNPGTGIYRVADLSHLWVQLDAYERDLAFLSRGQGVKLTVSAFPAESFEGRVAFVDPVLSTRTRTSKVRVELANRGGRLQPGMFAEAIVEGGAGGEKGPRPLVVPASAPLHTGRRSVVFVEVPDSDRPTYEAREVRLGQRTGELYPVVAGLHEGERVVTRGAFALDADLQIRGGASMMSRPDDGEAGELDRVVAADAPFLRSLEPVVGAYLSVQERLAADDLEAAHAAMRALGRELRRVRPPRPGEARDAWEPIAESLAGHARGGAEAEGMDAARAVFEHQSADVRALLERFGNPLDTPLRLAFCPMAFDDRGAEWVQRGEVIDNAYFGDLMRQCGEIRATVEPGRHLPASVPRGAPPRGGNPGHGGHGR